MLDAIRAHEQGVGSIEDIDTGMRAGASHPMGPLTLADFVGLDTLASIAAVMHKAYDEERFAAPATLQKLVDAGHFGRKSGRGFYDYAGEKPVAVEPDT
jgi:3-hydroxybutyryl-CoA dehydrogenase